MDKDDNSLIFARQLTWYTNYFQETFPRKIKKETFPRKMKMVEEYIAMRNHLTDQEWYLVEKRGNEIIKEWEGNNITDERFPDLVQYTSDVYTDLANKIVVHGDRDAKFKALVLNNLDQFLSEETKKRDEKTGRPAAAVPAAAAPATETVWFSIGHGTQGKELFEKCFRTEESAERISRRNISPLKGKKYLLFSDFESISVADDMVWHGSDSVYLAQANVPADLADGAIVPTMTSSWNRGPENGHFVVTVIEDGVVDVFDPNGPSKKLELWKKAIAAALGLKYKTAAESRFRQRPQTLITRDYGRDDDDPWRPPEGGMCQMVSAVKMWSIVADNDRMEKIGSDQDALNAYFDKVKTTHLFDVFRGKTSAYLSQTEAIAEWLPVLFRKLGLPIRPVKVGHWGDDGTILHGPIVTLSPEGDGIYAPSLSVAATVYPRSSYGPSTDDRASACITEPMFEALSQFMHGDFEEANVASAKMDLLVGRGHTFPIIVFRSENVLRTPVVPDLFPLQTSFHTRLLEWLGEKLAKTGIEYGVERAAELVLSEDIENGAFANQYNVPVIDDYTDADVDYTDTRVADMFSRRR